MLREPHAHPPGSFFNSSFNTLAALRRGVFLYVTPLLLQLVKRDYFGFDPYSLTGYCKQHFIGVLSLCDILHPSDVK